MSDKTSGQPSDPASESSSSTIDGSLSLPLDSAGAESESDVSTPLSATRASVSATDWTIETIVQQMRKRRIDLNPKFQRRAAWTNPIKSRFIESAILGFPIPQVVLAEHRDRQGHFLVIDGKQRLLALRQFYADPENKADDGFDPLRLTGLSILKEDLQGSTIDDLEGKPNDLFDAFENHTIRTVVIRNWETEDFLYTLFLRLNTGSVPLSPQELRQALVPGEFVDFVDLASGESQGLRLLLGNSGPDRRMIDAEMMVRFLGFRLSVVEYRGNLKLFLDSVCEALNDRWAEKGALVQAELAALEEAVSAASEIFGSDGACHKWSGTRWERSFNRAIFDVQMYVLSDPEARKASVEKSDAVLNAFKELCVGDEDFSRAVSTTTKSLDATKQRFSKWIGVVSGITGYQVPMPGCLEKAAT